MTTRARKSAKVTGKTIDYAERRRKALELRAAGMTIQGIADLHYNGSKGNAWKDIQKAYSQITQEPAELARKLELERLDAMTRAVYVQALKGDDKKIGTVLRLMERRSRLMGLDTPVQVETSGDGVINVVFDQAMNVANGMAEPELTVNVVED